MQIEDLSLVHDLSNPFAVLHSSSRAMYSVQK